MTKRKRPAQQIGIIKAALLIGSITATLLGARMVAVKDAQASAAATTTNSATNQQTVIITSQNGQPFIPAQMAPVTRSRSSR